MFDDLGRVRALKAREARPDDRRRRLRREPGRRGDRPPRAVRRPRVRPADAAPPARADRARAARRGRPQVDISFPEIEKFDHLPPPRVEGATRVRLDHGGLQQVLHVLRRALHARRGSLAAVRRRADRGRRPRRPGREGGDAARPERERLPRRAWPDGEIADFATAARARRRDPGHRAHPLHDVAPARDDAAPDRRVRDARRSSSRSCTCRCSRARTACSPR